MRKREGGRVTRVFTYGVCNLYIQGTIFFCFFLFFKFNTRYDQSVTDENFFWVRV